MLYFNSRPCGRGDGGRVLCFDQLLGISIHAPAGGATAGGDLVRRLDVISIHAPAGGATATGTGTAADYIISIHAPAGGATGRPVPW